MDFILFIFGDEGYTVESISFPYKKDEILIKRRKKVQGLYKCDFIILAHDPFTKKYQQM